MTSDVRKKTRSQLRDGLYVRGVGRQVKGSDLEFTIWKGPHSEYRIELYGEAAFGATLEEASARLWMAVTAKVSA